jgi:5-methylcytosine-specific restriction enzyme subunit McrC
MMPAVLSLTMSEWQAMLPEPENGLMGTSFGDSKTARRLAQRLSDNDVLRVTELRSGIGVQTYSYVGKVRLGNIEIAVLPKLNHTSLLNLVRYAYGLRKINRYQDTFHSVNAPGLEDLLIVQLLAEISELLSRGLHRRYIKRNASLSSPRGRINMQALAARGGLLEATLPCTHFPRIEDCPLNQALLAGLLLASRIAGDLSLRREARRLVTALEPSVSRVSLESGILRKALRTMNRLTEAYEASLTLIGLLCQSQGIVLEGEEATLRLPGFMFDMNRFFQALMGRFLADNLEGYVIQQECRLKHMMHYDPKFDPQKRPPPTPRPDFVVFKGQTSVAILDAKYRDLWAKRLPREMLYQLAIYGASHPSGVATILYPTYDEAASESRIIVTDPIVGRRIAEVRLRPVVLGELENLILKGYSADAQRGRTMFARKMAFGENGGGKHPV